MIVARRTCGRLAPMSPGTIRQGEGEPGCFSLAIDDDAETSPARPRPGEGEAAVPPGVSALALLRMPSNWRYTITRSRRSLPSTTELQRAKCWPTLLQGIALPTSLEPTVPVRPVGL
jgi:hypothetical protein